MGMFNEHFQETWFVPEKKINPHPFTIKRDVTWDGESHSCQTCPSEDYKGRCSTDSSICEFAKEINKSFVKCSFRK